MSPLILFGFYFFMLAKAATKNKPEGAHRNLTAAEVGGIYVAHGL
jgi:hypothetical protein